MFLGGGRSLKVQNEPAEPRAAEERPGPNQQRTGRATEVAAHVPRGAEAYGAVRRGEVRDEAGKEFGFQVVLREVRSSNLYYKNTIPVGHVSLTIETES